MLYLTLIGGAVRRERALPKDCLQQDPRLDQGELGAEAMVRAASERYPMASVGPVAHEPFRIECPSVGIQVGSFLEGIDVDDDDGVGGEHDVKSQAGIRDVAIPPHLVPALQAHMARHVGPEPNALLFPAQHGGHLAPASLYCQVHKARKVAGRDDLRFHDLRHSGAVLAAATGATLAELMARLITPHPRPQWRYQHAGTCQGR